MASLTVPPDAPFAGVRIGELSRRVGVSVDVLRAWERRYALLSPRRSPAGQRLYTAEDERRIRRMRETMARGYTAQVAAAIAAADTGEGPGGSVAPAGVHPFDPGIASLERLAGELRERLYAFDDAGANAALDAVLAGYTIDAFIRDVVYPLMHEIGDAWAREEVTVAQEHFASALLMGRLRSLSRGWDQGTGPRALLACPSGESHDLGLLCFALLLRQRGFRISYLGASVPGDALFDAAERLQPDVLVVSSIEAERFWNAFEALNDLAVAHRLVLGGAGAVPALGEQLTAGVLSQDPVSAADELATVAAR